MIRCLQDRRDRRVGASRARAFGAVRARSRRCCSRWVAAALAVGVLALASPASAKGLEGFLVGLNGVLTGPLDPFRHAITPPREFGDVPGNPASAHVLGVVSGTLLGSYRIVTGILDIALTPLLVIPNLSPEPQIEWFVIETQEEFAREP